MDNTDVKNELQSVAPFLASLEKKNNGGFQVPSPYFENSIEQVMAKIKAEEVQTANQRIVHIQASTRSRTKWFLRIAAGFLVLVVAVFAFQRYNQQHTTSQMASIAIPSETAEWYILSNLEDFQEELLQIDYTAPTDTSEQEQKLEEYLEYLLEDVDMETLEELL